MVDFHEYCKEKASKSGSSFYYSFLFLSTKQRQAITAIYAFCREVDDIVDESENMSIAARKLEWWATEINDTFNGRPHHPIAKALCEAKDNFALEMVHFQKIILGMMMDLNFQTPRTFEDLKKYCYHVASCVGLLAIEVFGYHHKETIQFAENLGISLQLTNIIRDIGEDARRGRVYLSEQDLEHHSLTIDNILNLQYSEKFKFLCIQYSNLAEEYYNNALLLLKDDDMYSQKASLIMSKIYMTLLQEMKLDDFKVVDQKYSLTPIRKFWIALRTFLSLRKYKNMSTISHA